MLKLIIAKEELLFLLPMDYSGSMRLYKRGFNAIRKSLSKFRYVKSRPVRELSSCSWIKFFGKDRNDDGVTNHSYWIVVSEFDFEILIGKPVEELDVNCLGYSYEMIINGGVVLRKEVDGKLSLGEFEEFCEVYWQERKGVYMN